MGRRGKLNELRDGSEREERNRKGKCDVEGMEKGELGREKGTVNVGRGRRGRR